MWNIVKEKHTFFATLSEKELCKVGIRLKHRSLNSDSVNDDKRDIESVNDNAIERIFN